VFVVFRADANPTIGTGHLMRCLALANALAAEGLRCLFLCRAAGIGALAERIRQAGHDLRLLTEGSPAATAGDDPPHGRWLPHGWAADLALCRQALAGEPTADWLVVDHYALDARWESAATFAHRRLIIDDLADRPHAGDLLLDSGLHSDPAARYRPWLNADCQLLAGPRYALLRPEFAARRQVRAVNATPPHLLVLFGGADADDLTGQTVALLEQLPQPWTADVVVGDLYPHRQVLDERLAGQPHLRLRVAPPDIAALMAQADIAIGAPGTTSWERCVLALPTIAIAVAANQESMAEALARQGAHLYLGRSSRLADTPLLSALSLLMGNPGWRQAMSQAAASITDGLGSRRLVRRMATAEVSIRPARLADAEILHRWRDDPRVRHQSFDTRPIPWPDHLAWCERTLADPARALLIASRQDEAIGCVRFDLSPPTARVSLYLDPNRLGQGLSIPVLNAAADWLVTHHPEVGQLRAEVRAGNAASRAAFLGAGYQPDHSVFFKALAATATAPTDH